MPIFDPNDRVVDRDTGRIGTVISGRSMTGSYVVRMDGRTSESVVWYPDAVIDALDSHAHILNALVAEVADAALIESWRNAWDRVGRLVAQSQLTEAS